MHSCIFQTFTGGTGHTKPKLKTTLLEAFSEMEIKEENPKIRDPTVLSPLFIAVHVEGTLDD